MYAVTVRDHLMIAHSFKGETFGPAQNLHGATYVVDVEFRRSELDPDNVVVDIGKASDVVKSVLSEMNYKNLDDVEEFRGQNTTTEFMARVVFDKVHAQIMNDALGSHAKDLHSLKVTLHESHIASASYECELQSGGRS